MKLNFNLRRMLDEFGLLSVAKDERSIKNVEQTQYCGYWAKLRSIFRLKQKFAKIHNCVHRPRWPVIDGKRLRPF